MAKLWLDRAQVAQVTGDAEGRVEALRQAVAVAPGWSVAARELADALDDAGITTSAARILTGGVEGWLAEYGAAEDLTTKI